MPVACLLAVGLAMGLSIRNGFVYDDLAAIVQNARVTDPALFHTIPSSPYWLGTLWRPFTVAMFAVQWRLGHGAPWIFHLTSLLGYVACGLALLALLRRLAVRDVPALAATLLFLVHPVHVEAVANGVGQAELWTALALLSATAIYLDARRRGVTIQAAAALLAMVIIGIAAKEQGFMAPLLLGGAEWLLFADRDEPAGTRLRLLAAPVALAVLLFVVRAGVLHSLAGEVPAAALRGLGPAGRVTTFLAVIPEYTRLLIWPVHLQAEYGPPGIPAGGPLSSRHLVGLALLAATVVLFGYTRRKNPAAAFGLWWAAVTLAPVSNLLTATGIVMAERVLFLPSIGFAIALAAVLQAHRAGTGDGRDPIDTIHGLRPNPIGMRRWHVAVATMLIAWGIGLTIRSATRVDTWRTQQQFYVALPRDAPQAYRAWKGAGEYWEGAGDHPRAIAMLRHAIDLWPHDYEVDERLGQFLRTDGDCADAIPVLAAGVRLDPDVPSLRAKLIECLIIERQWDGADRYVADALARGQTEFQSVRLRVARLRAAAQSKPGPP